MLDPLARRTPQRRQHPTNGPHSPREGQLAEHDSAGQRLLLEGKNHGRRDGQIEEPIIPKTCGGDLDRDVVAIKAHADLRERRADAHLRFSQAHFRETDEIKQARARLDRDDDAHERRDEARERNGKNLTPEALLRLGILPHIDSLRMIDCAKEEAGPEAHAPGPIPIRRRPTPAPSPGSPARRPRAAPARRACPSRWRSAARRPRSA